MKVFTPLFQAVIAFVAILTGLGIVFNLLLAPVKANQVNLDKRIDRIEAGQAKLSSDIDSIKEGQAELKQLFYEFKTHSHNPPKQARKNK